MDCTILRSPGDDSGRGAGVGFRGPGGRRQALPPCPERFFVEDALAAEGLIQRSNSREEKEELAAREEQREQGCPVELSLRCGCSSRRKENNRRP